MMDWLFMQTGVACSGGNLLFFPKWYKYLPSGGTDANGLCTPRLTGLNDVWLIAAAILEILLRVAAMLAIGFVIYGGYEYITSQGEPDKTAKARSTIISAIVGLIIAVMSTAIINFVAGRVN